MGKCKKVGVKLFSKVSPESAGISSKNVTEYLEFLNKRGVNMHSALISRGNKLFCEAYWAPYDCNTNHRMYSITKSFVGVAVCLLAAEGKISLDDSIVKYFPDKIKSPVHPFLMAQTVRHMLMMQTCMTDNNWFEQDVTDRLLHYFSHTPSHYPGTGFYYDSSAAFVLGALVERVTGLTLLDYLRQLGLANAGFSKSAYCLKAPGGHSWGDSGLICRPFDMLIMGRLIANGGAWKGSQLFDSNAVAEALKITTDTYTFGINGYSSYGYGSFIWHSYDGSIMFSGMHDQVMLYHPKSDILFVCTAGNNACASRELIVSGLFEYIIAHLQNPLPEDKSRYSQFCDCINSLKLSGAGGMSRSEFEREIEGKTYIVEEDNPMRITEFSLNFYDDRCVFCYTNEQGKKELSFGRNENIIQQFPQWGYSNEYGSFKTQNHTYRCAAAFAWSEPKRLSMSVKIIDEYIGLLVITIGFNGKYAWLQMHKEAEDFLNEYNGCASAEFKQENGNEIK